MSTKHPSVVFNAMVPVLACSFLDGVAGRQDLVNQQAALQARIDEFDTALTPGYAALAECGRVHPVLLNGVPSMLNLSKKRGAGGGAWQLEVQSFGGEDAPQGSSAASGV